MVYHFIVDDVLRATAAPRGWLEALAESEAEIAAGQSVAASVVHQDVRDAVARLEAKRAAERTAGQ